MIQTLNGLEQRLPLRRLAFSLLVLPSTAVLFTPTSIRFLSGLPWPVDPYPDPSPLVHESCILGRAKPDLHDLIRIIPRATQPFCQL